MIKGLQKKYNLDMTPAEVDDYVDHELGAVTAKLSEKATECPGATQQVEWIKSQGYPMAVVSTSAKPRVIASMKKVGMSSYFPDDKVFSAASMNPPTSKPDPAVYLHACKELGLNPAECVTVEDSKSGCTSATRAGIPLIGYVGVYGVEDGEEKMKQMAKVMTEECNAAVIMYDWKEFPECLKKIEAL